MPDSDGGKFSKAGLKRSITGALLFVAALTVAGGYVQLGYYEQAATQSTKHQAWAKNEIRRGCPSLPDLSKAQCLYQAKQAAQENERAEYDLYAQRSSALWASIMAFAALLGIGLSGVGVWLVKITFEETKRSNEIARTTAAKSAEHMNATMNAAVLAERAMVSVTGCTLFPPPLDTADGFMVRLSVENTGKSPARVLRVDYYIVDHPSFRKGSKRHKRMNVLVGMGGKANCSEFKIRAPKDYPKYLSGSITYATIYDAEFICYFCFRIRHGLSKDGFDKPIPERLEFANHPSMPADT